MKPIISSNSEAGWTATAFSKGFMQWDCAYGSARLAPPGPEPIGCHARPGPDPEAALPHPRRTPAADRPGEGARGRDRFPRLARDGVPDADRRGRAVERGC